MEKFEDNLTFVGFFCMIDPPREGVKEAIKSLGEMLGESVSEDVLNKIFEKFCVGK